MSQTVDKVEKVDTDRKYSLWYLVRKGMFGGVKTYSTARNKVFTDLLGKNLLKAEVDGTGTHRSIVIKGENLLAYLHEHGR